MRVPQPQRMVEVEIDKISAKVILRNRVQLTEMPLARFRKDLVDVIARRYLRDWVYHVLPIPTVELKST
jgi:hypothetical protein